MGRAHARPRRAMLRPVNLDLDALFRPDRAERERLAADARGRGRGDGRDEPSARDPRRPARARAGRERRRRGARRRGGADGRRADRQRRRRRRVRARLGRRRAARDQRLGPLARRARRPVGGGRRAALGDRARRGAALGRSRVALRPVRARCRGRARRPTWRGTGWRARRASPTSGPRPRWRRARRRRSGERYRLPELARDAAADRGGGPRRALRRRGRGRDRRGDAGSPRRICWRTGRSGSSRSAARTAASRSASCRRTARARRRSSRSRSTRGSSRGRTRRSRR